MSEIHYETPLAKKLKGRIRRDGPISVCAYMQACLHDPDHGYYRKKSAIGAQGDFMTAPEISQIFGELIGIWCAVAWRAMRAPKQVELLELGPGRGTLIRDAWRATRVVPGFLDAVKLHLVESNPVLRESQREALGDLHPAITWHADMACAFTNGEKFHEGPAIVIANEFLDAWPIEQVVFAGGKWHHRGIGLDEHGDFAFVRGSPVANGALSPAPPSPTEGDVFEHRPGLRDVASLLGQKSRRNPMAALFLDYGHQRTTVGETLQAVSAHRYVSPFESPGESDLTAHVDFEALSSHCRIDGLAIDGPITQSEFLLKMGLVERAEKLMASAPSDQVGLLEAGARRIADPMGMGGLFKVMCARSKSVPPLPPFAPYPAQ
ncbi:MAG TPA: SAM-dependent methyltransferase [Hyphomicrobiaceae bacterium]|nr:SAM-dependent methyltransferase [Hyphomicrobiaceae bacterium]